MATAAALSFAAIGAKSFWLDEAFSVAVASLDRPSLWQVVAHDQANMALYYLLLHFWLGIGSGEAAVRSLSAAFAVAALVPLYGLGTRLFGQRVAVLACLLLGVNAFFVRYAQEARAYSLSVFLVVVSSYLLLQALDRRTAWPWALYAVVSALAVYTHFFGVLFVGAHATSLLLVRPRSIRWRFPIAAYVATAILVAPLVPFILTVTHAGWVAPITARRFARALVELTGHGGLLLLAVYAILCAAAIVSSRRAQGTRGALALDAQHTFVLTWVVLPIATALVFSVLVRPIFVSRYLIGVLPALTLVAAAGLCSLRPRFVRAVALAAVLLLSARGLAAWYSGMPKEDWRGATTYVLARAEAGDHVAFHPPYISTAFDYYALPVERWSWTSSSSYPLPRGELGRLDADSAGGAFRVWLLVSKEQHVPLASLKPRWLHQPPAGSFCPVDEQGFHDVRVVRLVACPELLPLSRRDRFRAR